ncbi:MAG: hypothetical protein EA423_10720 [Phycisphaerales bacterium]|nr:MAG: hypothetical protein EA423_10720 [Phycisphaerales bacterium]
MGSTIRRCSGPLATRLGQKRDGRSKVRKPAFALALIAGAAAAWPSIAMAAQDGAADLPITQITLYRSGVGHFVRQGFVEGDADLQIRFHAEQINDVLKSMYLLDLGGGRIETVGYTSNAPLERRLGSFLIDISDSPSLHQLLDRLRGVPVKLETTDRTVEGKVLAIEHRQRPVGDRLVATPYVNLLTSAGIRSIQVESITSMQITDEKLARELERALLAIAEHRTDDVKSVDIAFRGEGRRSAVVGYVQEAPVWKTSYRLILPESDGNGQPHMQAWAIVENTTDEDWTDVRLSLASGQPVAFRMDLYEPLFVERPMVAVPAAANLRPRVYDAGVATAEARQLRREAAPRSRAAGQAQFQQAEPEADARFRDAPAFDLMMVLSETEQGRAAAGSVGEVFQYTLDMPVTIERQRSAMLPIISAPIEGRRVSIYSQGAETPHPMRGVELTNDAGLQLMPGPISVYDGSAYAGDAQIGHVGAGDSRMLAYAADLDVRILTESDSARTLRQTRIVNGTVVRTIGRTHAFTYKIANADASRGRTIVIEHNKMSGWQLASPTPVEETQRTHRFEKELGPGETAELVIRHERTDQERISVATIDSPTIFMLEREGRISGRALEALREALSLREAVGEAERLVALLENERREIVRDQERVRANLASVARESDLHRRYMDRLGEQETRLDEIATELAEARSQVERRKRALERFVSDLNVG